MRAYVGGQMEATEKRVNTLIESGKLEEAVQGARHLIARGTELGRDGPNSPPVAKGFGLLAMAEMNRGRLLEAEKAPRRSLAIVERAGNARAVARVSGLLGKIVGRQGRQAEAEALFTRSLAVLDKEGDSEDRAYALLSLAEFRTFQGRLAEADSVARSALAIFEKGSGVGKAGIARTLGQLAHIASIAARYADAEDYAKRALAAGEAAFAAGHWEMPRMLGVLGRVYADTGRHAEAEPLLRRAIEGIEAAVGPEHQAAFITLRSLGKSRIEMGDLDEADLLLRRALAAVEKVGGSRGRHLPSLQNIYLQLSRVAHLRGRMEEAEALIKSSLQVGKEIDEDGPYLAGSLIGLGKHYMGVERLDDSRLALERALAVAEKTSSENFVALNALRYLAELDLRAGRPGEALEKLKRIATTLDARREGASISAGRFSDEIPDLLRWVALGFSRAAWPLEKGDGLHAGEAFWGAQLLGQSSAAFAVAQMAARFAASDDELGKLVRQGQDLLQQWQAIDRQLTEGYLVDSKDAKERRALRAERERINKELVAVNRRLATEFPQYAELTRPGALRIAEVQKELRPEEALVTFLVGERGSFVWAISRDGFAWRRLPIGEQALAEKIERLRKGLEVELDSKGAVNRIGLLDLELAHGLYASLLAPVEGILVGKSSLLIVPSGVLTSLPFNLLVTDPPGSQVTDPKDIPAYRDASWIIRRHAITVLPSVASLKALRAWARPAAGEKPLVGFGDPTFDAGRKDPDARPPARPARSFGSLWKGARVSLAALRGLEPLPESTKELRTVGAALGAPAHDLHLGAAASEATVKRLDLRPYRVVYFATHALVAGDLKGLGEPALALSTPATATELDDGLLAASEVARLKLNADWVVLSACSTAAGDKAGAEAFSGLARAFFYAGARSLLVSHWPVDSDAAVKLTTGTFAVLKQNPGMGRAEALRQSMLAYMHDPADPLSAHPAFWGPFAVVGEGGG